MAEGLNHNQQVFVSQYLLDGNGTRAYRVAYPDSSAAAARSSAPVLLANPSVQSAIQEGRRDLMERTQITQDMTIREIAKIAYADPRRAFDEAGNMLPIHLWPDDLAATISGFKIKRMPGDDSGAELVEVKTWDKNAALEKAAKIQGLYELDNRQKGQVRVTLADTDEAL